jgi:hypothetical protein
MTVDPPFPFWVSGSIKTKTDRKGVTESAHEKNLLAHEKAFSGNIRRGASFFKGLRSFLSSIELPFAGKLLNMTVPS